ncbi:MAG: hypothetical protein AAFO06_10180 [Cyanobacteria bacterium J06597_16]
MTIPQYDNLAAALQGICQVWCNTQGYSNPFRKDGEWWAFPPNGVIPVQIKTVMGETSHRLVKIDSLTLALFPDGSLVRKSTVRKSTDCQSTDCKSTDRKQATEET